MFLTILTYFLTFFFFEAFISKCARVIAYHEKDTFLESIGRIIQMLIISVLWYYITK